MNKMIIAVDGPAGSGKSTVAREVAKKLSMLYIDTGAMYRAFTLKAMNENISFENEKVLIDLFHNTDISLKHEGEALRVFLDKEDVTESIRSLDVTSNVKHLALLKGVRKNMVSLQRDLARAATSGAVLEGRDIGTVVFPDAKFKFYLDASIDVRAMRRFKELKEKGTKVSLEEIKKDVRERDESDIKREIGPLKKAEDAITVDTTGMTIEEVVERILKTCH